MKIFITQEVLQFSTTIINAIWVHFQGCIFTETKISSKMVPEDFLYCVLEKLILMSIFILY